MCTIHITYFDHIIIIILKLKQMLAYKMFNFSNEYFQNISFIIFYDR
jgi:hypothetical protein